MGRSAYMQNPNRPPRNATTRPGIQLPIRPIGQRGPGQRGNGQGGTGQRGPMPIAPTATAPVRRINAQPPASTPSPFTANNSQSLAIAPAAVPVPVFPFNHPPTMMAEKYYYKVVDLQTVQQPNTARFVSATLLDANGQMWSARLGGNATWQPYTNANLRKIRSPEDARNQAIPAFRLAVEESSKVSLLNLRIARLGDNVYTIGFEDDSPSPSPQGPRLSGFITGQSAKFSKLSWHTLQDILGRVPTGMNASEAHVEIFHLVFVPATVAPRGLGTAVIGLRQSGREGVGVLNFMGSIDTIPWETYAGTRGVDAYWLAVRASSEARRRVGREDQATEIAKLLKVVTWRTSGGKPMLGLRCTDPVAGAK